MSKVCQDCLTVAISFANLSGGLELPSRAWLIRHDPAPFAPSWYVGGRGGASRPSRRSIGGGLAATRSVPTIDGPLVNGPDTAGCEVRAGVRESSLGRFSFDRSSTRGPRVQFA